MANENATWRWSTSPQCATAVESAIVPWYWFGTDINTGAARRGAALRSLF
jgi:hypothetical protein